MRLFNLKNLRFLLPALLAYTTGQPRYFPIIKWSKNSWVHNIFRVYELIFGRKYGIRPESSTAFKVINGRKVLVHEYYTFEALCAGFESWVRNKIANLKDFKLTLPVKIYYPTLAGALGFKLPSQFLFAIAYDTSVAASFSGGGSNTVTFSHTCTGSNLILFVHGTGNQSPTPTLTSTYNSVSMTEVGHSIDSVGTGVPTYMFQLVAPATGANNVAVTSSTNAVTGSSISYSGVAQTSPIDNSDSTKIDTTTASFSKSLTVNTANSWIVAFFRTGVGNALTAGTNTTVRQQPEIVAFGSGEISDTNSAQSTGSQTLNWTCTSQYIGGCVIASFKPVAVTAVVSNSTLLLMGVG